MRQTNQHQLLSNEWQTNPYTCTHDRLLYRFCLLHLVTRHLLAWGISRRPLPKALCCRAVGFNVKPCGCRVSFLTTQHCLKWAFDYDSIGSQLTQGTENNVWEVTLNRIFFYTVTVFLNICFYSQEEDISFSLQVASKFLLFYCVLLASGEIMSCNYHRLRLVESIKLMFNLNISRSTSARKTWIGRW